LRYPEELLSQVKETIELQWAAKFSDPGNLALLDGDDGMNAILGVVIEPPTPVDPKSVAKCFRKTKTMKDFFGAASKNKVSAPSTSVKPSSAGVSASEPKPKKPKTSIRAFFDLSNPNPKPKPSTQPKNMKSCCVCGHEFSSNALNAEINAHIDECLANRTL